MIHMIPVLKGAKELGSSLEMLYCSTPQITMIPVAPPEGRAASCHKPVALHFIWKLSSDITRITGSRRPHHLDREILYCKGEVRAVS